MPIPRDRFHTPTWRKLMDGRTMAISLAPATILAICDELDELRDNAEDDHVWLVEDASTMHGYHTVSDGTFHVLAPSNIAQMIADMLNDEQSTPTTHTRTATTGPDSGGPDFCAECSKAANDWVPWPCPAIMTPK